jgi:hypothetical protein
MCGRCGYLHLIVSASAFRLIRGSDTISTYTFNTQTAKHLFCSICGVKSFYVPRSHPDGYSVNARCLDDASIAHMKVLPFDGENWEANARDLPPEE